TGIHLSDSDNNDIFGNIISNNSNEGIKIRGSDRNKLSNNTAVSNGGSAIYLEFGNNNIISENNASMNHNGISLINSIYNNFLENTVQNNYQRGIYLEQSNRNNILQNNVSNNSIGISLIQSNYNNIIGNTFESNTLTNCEESMDCVGNYFKGNKGCPDTLGIFPLEIVILLIIIIISVMFLTGLLVVKQKAARKNLSIEQLKGEGTKSKKFMEMSKTEADLKEEKHMCVVHRGDIVGAMYLCPKCETYYCMKCAIALKNKGETCWVCNNKIELE
ncbi:MAG: nitrous oxide reductase family maturation protein NosD, partial [Promethearchaeota archaeon]